MRNAIRPGIRLATAMAAVLSAPAFAQSGSSGGVEEIIVTAQRKGESVLDVPLSIQATSGDALASAGIKQMSDLQLTTPGFATSNASGYNQMFIRGIGNSIFVGADPSVATFIDEVPRVFGSMVNNFVDVERVEVIKGAPGGLYGRNATGGAVNIITRQPDTEAVHATFRASYGEKETFGLSGYVNLPLSDKIAVSVTGERRSHDGYIRNVTPNATAWTAAMFPVNNVAGPGTASFLGTPTQTAAALNGRLSARKSYVTEDFWALGGKILIKPTDTFKITIAGDYSEKDDDNGNGLYNLRPDYAIAVASQLFNNYLDGSTTPVGLSPLIGQPIGKFETAQRGEGYVKLKDWGVSGTAVLNLDGVDLTSITAYRENKSRFQTELGFLPFNFLAANVDIDKSTLYQELRAASTGEGPLSWIVGGSYLRAKFDGGLATTIFGGPIPALSMLPSGSGRYTVTNWSAFVQAGYDITDRLNLTVSGRYVSEKNDAVSFNPIANRQDPFLLKQDKFLPSATLKYSLEGGGNVYARWARGFKAGGIVPVVPTSIFTDPINQGGAFRGETVDSYEVGLRTALLDRKLQLTAAVFYNDYRDVQVAAHVSPTFPNAALVSISVVNAGSARTYGAELGLTARVAEPLTLTASAGYLNAKYKTFRFAPNAVLDGFDLSGARMINSPEWQLAFGADLDQPINDNLKLVGNVLASYTDKIIWQQSGLTGVLADSVGPSYWLVNARFGVRSSDDKYELAVYAKNLFNQAYTTFGNSSSSYGNILAWGDPRIIGVEATVKF